MELSVGRIIEIGAVVIFTSFFPILTYSFFKFRLVRKQEELMLLLEKVKLVSDINLTRLKESMEREYSPKDYVLPVFFMTLVTLLGMFLLLLGWMIYTEHDAYLSVLVSGADFWMKADSFTTERRSVAVIAFAITGGYISASQYIYRRYSTIDLTPGNFFSVGLRTIMAAMISLMLSFLFDGTVIVQSNTILVIAFLTGIFPESGMRLLMEKAKFFTSPIKNAHKNYSLDHIEGISEMHKIRLNELGIDNVQNLAHYNFLMIIIKTPFPVHTLLDWMSQAKLLIEFQEDFTSLQKVGIRNVLDFRDAMTNKNISHEEIAEACTISKLSLAINFQNIQNDQSVSLLNHFRNHLENFNLD